MSPELIDLDAAKRPGWASKPAPPTHRPAGRRDLPDPDPPLAAALPAILNPCIEAAPAAVMTRIALDRIIQGTPLDRLFDRAAEGQYTREFTLEHRFPDNDVSRSPNPLVSRREHRVPSGGFPR
jgi:hypothetical protein